jgi:hypothetical protein
MVMSPQGLGPKKGYAGECASSIYKSQTRPLIREDAHKNRAVIVKD